MPRKVTMEHIGLSAPKSMKTRLQKRATQQDISLSKLIISICKEYLKNTK